MHTKDWFVTSHPCSEISSLGTACGAHGFGFELGLQFIRGAVGRQATRGSRALVAAGLMAFPPMGLVHAHSATASMS